MGFARHTQIDLAATGIFAEFAEGEIRQHLATAQDAQTFAPDGQARPLHRLASVSDRAIDPGFSILARVAIEKNVYVLFDSERAEHVGISAIIKRMDGLRTHRLDLI